MHNLYRNIYKYCQQICSLQTKVIKKKNNNVNDWQKYKLLRIKYQEELDEAEKDRK